jgi:thymidine kinase
MSQPLRGSLEIKIGPMFSGKTTWLVNTYHSVVAQNETVVVINYADDKRYHDTMLSTHDLVMIPCIQAKTLAEVASHPSVVSASAVLINEGQFFQDIYDVVVNMVEVDHKRVYICGLDGDFKRNKFGGLLDLIPLADNVQKLTSNCHVCNHAAPFSHRITSETSQIVIGSSNYIPLCRSCYIGENKLVECVLDCPASSV